MSAGDLSLGLFAFLMVAITGAGFLLSRMRPASPAPGSGGHAEPGVPLDWLSALLVSSSRLVAPGGSAPAKLHKLLFRAGYRSANAAAVFQGIQVATAVVLGLTAVVASSASGGDGGLLAALCGAGFGFLLPSRVLEVQVRARATRIRSAIPPALDLMVLALEAGQPLDQALQDTAAAIRRVFPDLSSELGFCTLEMRAGTSRPEALRRLGERTGEEELRKLAAVLIDGERFGTTLGPALRTHSHYLRTRMRQRAQESARKLTVKLVFPVFFLIFPAVLVVTLGPAYFQLREFLDGLLR